MWSEFDEIPASFFVLTVQITIPKASNISPFWDSPIDLT